MKLLNGITIEDGRLILGVDWSRTKIDVYNSKTERTEQFSSLETVAKAHPGAVIILEATAESFELQKRAEVLKAFEANNISAFSFKTQFTSKFRIKWKITKTDKADAKVIYRIATETALPLKRFGALRDSDPLRAEIKKTLVEDRYMHEGKPSAALAEKFLNKVNIPENFHSILVDKETKKSRTYRASVGRILQVAVAVKQAGRGYREFRRQLGNYGNGYESMPRSEHNWHLTIYEVRRRLKAAGIEPTKIKLADPKTGEKFARIWTDKELEIKRAVQKDVVKAAQFLWRLV